MVSPTISLHSKLGKHAFFVHESGMLVNGRAMLLIFLLLFFFFFTSLV